MTADYCGRLLRLLRSLLRLLRSITAVDFLKVTNFISNREHYILVTILKLGILGLSFFIIQRINIKNKVYQEVANSVCIRIITFKYIRTNHMRYQQHSI